MDARIYYTNITRKSEEAYSGTVYMCVCVCLRLYTFCERNGCIQITKIISTKILNCVLYAQCVHFTSVRYPASKRAWNQDKENVLYQEKSCNKKYLKKKTQFDMPIKVTLAFMISYINTQRPIEEKKRATDRREDWLMRTLAFRSIRLGHKQGKHNMNI